MPTPSSNNRYPSLLIAIHWLTLLLLAGVYICIEGREYFPRGSVLRDGMKTWHFMLGLSVFALIWVRLLLRMTSTIPPGYRKYKPPFRRLAADSLAQLASAPAVGRPLRLAHQRADPAKILLRPLCRLGNRKHRPSP